MTQEQLRDIKLWDAAVEYCNENHKGDDRKYAACHKTFLDAITSEAAREYWEGQGWVSVKDRLPELPAHYSDKWVLCCTVFGACLLSLYYYDHESKNWYDAVKPEPETRISHWRPLPAPPNQ